MKIYTGSWKDNPNVENEKDDFIFINSNGSRWHGEKPATIEELLEVLKKYTLRAGYNGTERNPVSCYYKPLFKNIGIEMFYGNFEEISHVFCIYTNHQETINSLRCAMGGNKGFLQEVQP
jgi:hypothetical protein